MSFSPETPSATDLRTVLLALGVANSSPIFGSAGRAADLSRALAAFQILCEASHDRSSLLRHMEADPLLGDAVWTILGGPPSLSDALVRNAELFAPGAGDEWLKNPRTPEQARAACRDFCFAFQNRRAALRNWRERELLRIALRDFAFNAPSSETTLEIALLAGAGLDLAVDEIEAHLFPDANSLAVAVVALGEFGGLEMHTSSDIDVAFVCEFPSRVPEQNALAVRFAQELSAFLGGEDESGTNWKVRTSLHPRGALVFAPQTLHDYFNDPRSGFGVAQRHALTKARFAAGNSDLGARAMTSIRGAAHPPGWDFDWNDELLAIKERAEREHAAQNGNDVFDVGFSPGTLCDIEWAAGWMALKHGHDVPTLQTPNTRTQLLAARGANLLAGVESGALLGAYDWFRRAQLRLQFARDSDVSSVKRDSNDFQIWARAMLPTQPQSDAPVVFEETWRVHAQNVRMIFERVRDML